MADREVGGMNVEILEGEPFDWEQGSKDFDKYNESRPFMAASCVDPGIISCPMCRHMYWAEGFKVRCNECKHVWKPNG